MNDFLKQLSVNALMLLGGGLAVFLYLTLSDIRDKNVGQSVETPPARETRAPTVTATPPRGVQVHKPVVKKELNLPKHVQENKDVAVVAATKVERAERPQTATTTLNTQTGEFQTYVRPDPYPWIAVETRGEARLSLGYKHRSGHVEQVVRASLGYDVLRVKALTAGVVAQVDSDGDTFVGIGMAYRW